MTIKPFFLVNLKLSQGSILLLNKINCFLLVVVKMGRKVAPESYYQDEPNSRIHFSYFIRSSWDTLLLHFASASMKSWEVTGRSRSSLDNFLISSGFKPWILRLIDIIDASLQK